VRPNTDSGCSRASRGGSSRWERVRRELPALSAGGDRAGRRRARAAPACAGRARRHRCGGADHRGRRGCRPAPGVRRRVRCCGQLAGPVQRAGPGRGSGELWRVLRPGGRLFFWEHVRAGGPVAARMQRALDATVWPILGGGCHTARDTAAAIERAGFTSRADRALLLPRRQLPDPDEAADPGDGDPRLTAAGAARAAAAAVRPRRGRRAGECLAQSLVAAHLVRLSGDQRGVRRECAPPSVTPRKRRGRTAG
jgi:hypothetical protein